MRLAGPLKRLAKQGHFEGMGFFAPYASEEEIEPANR